MNQIWRKKSLMLVIAGGLVVCTAAGDVLAQRRSQKRTPAAPSAPSAGKGLEGLSTQELLGELSGRGLESLLRRAFDQNNVPEDEQNGFLAMQSLRELTDPEAKLTQGQRQRLLQSVVAGLKTILPQLKSSTSLMEYAALLIKEGAMREVNTMEYWGETAASQNRLRPIAESIDAMLERAIEEAKAEKEEIQKRMAGNVNNERLANEWIKIDELEMNAAFTRAMAAYYRAISIPNTKGNKEKRIEIADKAIDVLKEHDNEDSGIQAAVRNRMAKLSMAKGEYDAAANLFKSVINGEVEPKPDANQVYEAKYFAAVCSLLRGDVRSAQKDLLELDAWQKEAFSGNEEALKGVEAAADMLRYRIASAEAEMSEGPAKQKAEDTAISVLMNLNEKRPDLRPIIFTQLVERIGMTRPVKDMDPLLLQAMLQKGLEEIEKGEDEKLNEKVLERSIEAANELVARYTAGDEKLKKNEKLVESAVLLAATFQEKLGRKVEAASAYLDFIEKFPKNTQREQVFNQAGRLIVLDLRRGPDKGDKEVVAVWERFLPVAIGPPFNRKDLAYDYAQRLRLNKKYKEAAEHYAMVPSSDPRYVASKYLQMISLTGLLDQQRADRKPLVQGEERQALASQILQLCEEVKKLAQAAAAKATDPEKKQREQLRAAGCVLTAAQVSAAELKQPERTLQILQGFEKLIQGLPAAEPMLNDVLFLRVGSFMDSGQYSKATDTLLALLDKTEGEKGQNIVLGLLQKLEEDLTKAAAAGEKERVATLATNRARLSGFLVEWAEESKNPEIKKFAYGYRVFDAESKLHAGQMNNDKKMLAEARKAFERLLQPDMVAKWQEQQAGNPRFDKNSHHPNVLLGLGNAAFDLGDYRTAQEHLGNLVGNRRLGASKVQKVDSRTGLVTYADNEPYWEAWYKLLRSNVELYKSNKGDEKAQKAFEDAKAGLKRLYIVENPPGGEKWKDEFEALRKDIIPDFDPASIPLSEPKTPEEEPAEEDPEAAQPVAAGGGEDDQVTR